MGNKRTAAVEINTDKWAFEYEELGTGKGVFSDVWLHGLDLTFKLIGTANSINMIPKPIGKLMPMCVDISSKQTEKIRYISPTKGKQDFTQTISHLRHTDAARFAEKSLSSQWLSASLFPNLLATRHVIIDGINWCNCRLKIDTGIWN